MNLFITGGPSLSPPARRRSNCKRLETLYRRLHSPVLLFVFLTQSSALFAFAQLDINSYTEDELKEMTAEELTDVMTKLGIKGATKDRTGDQIDRILSHQTQSPSNAITPVARNDGSLDAIKEELRLTTDTVKFLKAKNYFTADDLQLLTESDMEKLKIPQRDIKVILRHIGKLSDSSVLKVDNARFGQQQFNAVATQSLEAQVSFLIMPMPLQLMQSPTTLTASLICRIAPVNCLARIR